jgi:hypothetical protein
MRDWIIPGIAMAATLVVFLGIAWRNTRKQIANTLAIRPNPTREHFLEMMLADVSLRSSEFLWETTKFYLEPRLAAHPDDDLIRDLPICEEDWAMDWPRDFADRAGFIEEDYPDWPNDWPTTIRNYGKWLDMGFERSQAKTAAQ